jgi:F0F1-type ATP synthase assembly protein I
VPDGRAPYPKWVRYSSLGIELGAAVALPTILGAWADRRWDTGPWGLLVGLCLGLVGGLYRFIRSSLAAMREAATADQGADQATGQAADQITEKDS